MLVEQDFLHLWFVWLMKEYFQHCPPFIALDIQLMQLIFSCVNFHQEHILVCLQSVFMPKQNIPVLLHLVEIAPLNRWNTHLN